MEVLRSILEGKLSKDQQQRAKAKLRGQYPPYSVERNRLNNADRYINEQVFNKEKASANAYNSSQMPPPMEEKGKVFKIQAYANPFVGSLRGKLTLSQQLITQINFAREQTRRGAQVSAGAVIFTPSLMTNNFFGTKDVLIEFNEMMNYIKNYVPPMTTDANFQDKVFNAMFVPILQLIDQTIQSYANVWNSLPDFQNNEQKLIRDQIRKLMKKCYVMYNVMYELINSRNFTPLTDAMMEDYYKQNNVEQDILNNFPKGRAPLPIPLPPIPQPIAPAGPNVPAPQPQQQPAPPIPRPDQIGAIDPAVLAQFNPPASLVNTNGQTISNRDYFLFLGLRWANREEEFLSGQQIPRFEGEITLLKGRLEQQRRKLEEIQRAGVRRQVEGELLQQIAGMEGDLKRLEGELAGLNVRKVELFKAQELLTEYAREVAKIPTTDDGNVVESEFRKIPQGDLRRLANNERVLIGAIGLRGFGVSGGDGFDDFFSSLGQINQDQMDRAGQTEPLGITGNGRRFYHDNDDYMRILPITDDHRDFIPLHNSEFEMKRRMADRARGDPRLLEPDQNIPTRMAMFPEDSEFNPSFELLKRGFKANDTVMEPDRSMSDVMPTETGRFEASGIPDDENATAFKMRFGLPFSQHAKRTDDRPIVVEHKRPFTGFFDIDGNDEFSAVKNFEDLYKPVEHFKVEEEPDDILNHPDEFKRKIESYRFNTGRMKNKPSFMK